MEEQIRWFYGTIGCLDEVCPSRAESGSPVAEGREQPGAVWSVNAGLRMLFRSARIELRIQLSASPKVESAGFPVVLAVPSLEAAIDQLGEESWCFERLTGTTWADDCVATLDPAGNRVELRREWREI